MDFQEISVPFFIDNIYEGFAKANGILSFRKNCLLLHFQVQDTIIGLINGDEKKVSLSFDEVDDIEYKQGGLFSHYRIVINTCVFLKSKGLPSKDTSSLTLFIDKKQAEKAFSLASAFNIAKAEARLHAAENL